MKIICFCRICASYKEFEFKIKRELGELLCKECGFGTPSVFLRFDKLETEILKHNKGAKIDLVLKIKGGAGSHIKERTTPLI